MAENDNKQRLFKDRLTTAFYAALIIVGLILGAQEILYFSSEDIAVPGLALSYGMNFVPAVSFLLNEITH